MIALIFLFATVWGLFCSSSNFFWYCEISRHIASSISYIRSIYFFPPLSFSCFMILSFYAGLIFLVFPFQKMPYIYTLSGGFNSCFQSYLSRRREIVSTNCTFVGMGWRAILACSLRKEIRLTEIWIVLHCHYFCAVICTFSIRLTGCIKSFLC